MASSDAKLLHPCPVCERPVFLCEWGGELRPVELGRSGLVAVHVLEQRRGHIAIQATLGSDELVAVDVRKSARTFYSVHRCRKLNVDRRRATSRVRNKRFRTRRALEDKCLDCPGAPEPGRSRCRKHLDDKAAANRRYVGRGGAL